MTFRTYSLDLFASGEPVNSPAASLSGDKEITVANGLLAATKPRSNLRHLQSVGFADPNQQWLGKVFRDVQLNRRAVGL